MAQQLRALAALPENPNPVPSIHVGQLTTTYNSRGRGLNALFWPPQAHAHTHKEIKIQNKPKKKKNQLESFLPQLRFHI